MIFWNSLAFFYDPVDVGCLISGSSAFLKSRLNIWKFSVHLLLKSGLDNLDHYFANVWNECNCGSILNILWHCISLWLEWKLTISSPVGTAEFSKFTGIYCHTVNPKRNQLWILTGSMDAEAEAPPDAKSQLIGKDSDVGKGWREKGKVIAKDVVVRQHHWFSGY